MKPVKDMTVGELAAFIASHLEKQGIDVVLSGGSCVTIYSRQQYVSADLDFIEQRSIRRKNLRKALGEIGFYEENRYFKHPETEIIVEFPPGPLAAGGEPLKDIIVMEFATGSLKLI